MHSVTVFWATMIRNIFLLSAPVVLLSLLAYCHFALFAALCCVAFLGALLALEIYMCRRPSCNPSASDADLLIPLMIVACIAALVSLPSAVFRYFSV